MKCTEDVYLHNPQSILQTYNTHFIFKLQLKQSDTQPDYHCDMRSSRIVKCYISHYSTFWFTFVLDSHSVINTVTVALPVTEDIYNAGITSPTNMNYSLYSFQSSSKL